MGKFRQTTSELWPLIDVKNCILFVSALLVLVDTGKEWFGIVDG